MTVVFFANTSWYLSNFRLDFAKHLREDGHRVVFVSKRDGKYDKKIEDEGFTFLDLKFKRGRLSIWSNIVAIVELAQSLRVIRADLLHNYTIQSILLGTIAGRIAGVRFFINSFTGLGSVLGQVAKATLSQRLLILALRSVMYRGEFRVIAQNDADYQRLISFRLRPVPEILLVRGSGINLKTFPGKNATTAGEITVVCLARLIKDKGIFEYVQAAHIVAEKAPHVKFLLAGSEDPGNPNAISPSILNGWRRESNIELLGHVDEAKALLDRSDILVLPSYREGFPRTILEAFAMGLPVVTCDVPGCRDLVANAVNGLVVPPKDPEALAGAILELVDSPARRSAFGASGRRLVEDHFSSEAHAKEMKAVYSALAGPL